MKHTPGEWLVYAKIFAKSAVISVMKSGGSKEIVHWTGFDASDFQRQNLANAHLISAAPNLLKACRAADAYLAAIGDPERGATRSKLRAAIAKALSQ